MKAYNKENIEEGFFDYFENNLNPQDKAALEKFLAENTSYMKDFEMWRKSYVTESEMPEPHMEDLLKPEAIPAITGLKHLFLDVMVLTLLSSACFLIVRNTQEAVAVSTSVATKEIKDANPFSDPIGNSSLALVREEKIEKNKHANNNSLSLLSDNSTEPNLKTRKKSAPSVKSRSSNLPLILRQYSGTEENSLSISQEKKNISALTLKPNVKKGEKNTAENISQNLERTFVENNDNLTAEKNPETQEDVMLGEDNSIKLGSLSMKPGFLEYRQMDSMFISEVIKTDTAVSYFDSPQKEPKNSIGLSYSPDYCYRYIKDGEPNKKYNNSIESPMYGYLFELRYARQVTEKIRVDCGFGVSKRGYAINYKDSVTVLTGFQNNNFMEIPLRLSYSFGQQKIHYNAVLGVALSKKINEWTAGHLEMEDNFKKEITEIGVGYDYDVTYNISAIIGMGLDYHINSRWRINATPELRYYFKEENAVDLFSGNPGVDAYNATRSPRNLFTAGLDVGLYYKFNLPKAIRLSKE